MRRALNQELFEEKGVRRAGAEPAPVLDVELLNFAEIAAPAYVALVRLTFSLRDEHTI